MEIEPKPALPPWRARLQIWIAGFLAIVAIGFAWRIIVPALGKRAGGDAQAERAKVIARMRNLAFALHAYRADWGVSPLSAADGRLVGGFGDGARVLERLTTPQAFLASFQEPETMRYWAFARDEGTSSGLRVVVHDASGRNDAAHVASLLQAAGPRDGLIELREVLSAAHASEANRLIYDPTNGADSGGNIFGLSGDHNLRPLPQGAWDDNMLGAIRGVEE